MKKTVCILMVLVLAVSMTLTLSGCFKSYDSEINVFNWGENISDGTDGSMDVIREFEDKFNIKVNYTTYETNEELYSILSSSNSSYDIVIPSDYMIEKLISEDLLTEINFENVPNHKNIADTYKNLPFDPDNKYSVPYTWGVVALCYNKNMIGNETIKGFADLWNENLKGEILMIDNSRDAMAIAMQLSGITPDKFTKAEVDTAAKKLSEQKPLLKKYVMDMVFTEMEGEQAAIAPYYAGDIYSMIQNNENLAYCLPEEGSNFFVDSMCIPKSTQNKEGAELFINFMLEAKVGAANAEYIGYSTPNSEAFKLLPEEIQSSELIYPSEEYLSKCYSFADLDKEVYSYMQEKFIEVKAE